MYVEKQNKSCKNQQKIVSLLNKYRELLQTTMVPGGPKLYWSEVWIEYFYCNVLSQKDFYFSYRVPTKIAILTHSVTSRNTLKPIIA